MNLLGLYVNYLSTTLFAYSCSHSENNLQWSPLHSSSNLKANLGKFQKLLSPNCIKKFIFQII